MGRPSKYHDKIPELFIQAMKNGDTIVEFCASQDISKQTFHVWRHKEPLLNDAYTRGLEFAEAYWLAFLKQKLSDNKANAPLIKFYFQNRFGWTDKQSVDQKTEVSVSDTTQRKVRQVLDGE